MCACVCVYGGVDWIVFLVVCFFIYSSITFSFVIFFPSFFLLLSYKKKIIFSYLKKGNGNGNHSRRGWLSTTTAGRKYKTKIKKALGDVDSLEGRGKCGRGGFHPH